MCRPVKNWREWTEITIPYFGNWEKAAKETHYLEDILDEHEYEIRVTKEYPKPRKQWANKVITHHYYIKDPKIATLFSLKFS